MGYGYETLCVTIAKHNTFDEAMTDWIVYGGALQRSLNFLSCVEIWGGDEEAKTELELNFWTGVTAWDYNRGEKACYGDCPTEGDYPPDYRPEEIVEKREELLELARDSMWRAFEILEELCKEGEWEVEDVCRAFKDLIYADKKKKEELIDKVSRELVDELVDYVKKNYLS